MPPALGRKAAIELRSSLIRVGQPAGQGLPEPHPAGHPGAEAEMGVLIEPDLSSKSIRLGLS